MQKIEDKRQIAIHNMRHSDIKLTMNVYTDPKLLDVVGALEALPSLPLNGPDQNRAGATGTDGARTLAPVLALTAYNHGQPQSQIDISNTGTDSNTIAVSVCHVNKKDPLTTAVNGSANRGDKTPIELFFAGVRTWDAVLRRIFTGKSMLA